MTHPAKIFGVAKRALAGRGPRKLLKQDSGIARDVVKPLRRPDEFPLALADTSRPAFPRPCADRREGEHAHTHRPATTRCMTYAELAAVRGTSVSSARRTVRARKYCHEVG